MASKFFSKDFNHLGIVAIVCDQIGLVDAIDAMTLPDPRADLTIGETIKLMVINGLGFTSRPLYLESQFFQSKPINRLIGRNVPSEQITDDRLGRCLDRCFTYGCSELFAKVATRAALTYGVDQRFRHLDTTSMNVEGEYEEEGIGLIRFGYSKDHRSDLKQFMISLMSSKDGDVPLLAQTIAGNSSDKTHFREVLQSLKNQMDPQEPFYYVADSALYNKETIGTISEKMMWITRVPETLKAAKSLTRSIPLENMEEIGNGYRLVEIGSQYGNIPQRWVLVFSEQAQKREKKTLEKRIKKEIEEKGKALKNLRSKEFGCQKDALTALRSFEKKLKYLKCQQVQLEEKPTYQKRGRPTKGSSAKIVFRIQALLERDEEKIGQLVSEKGKFIIATNELDEIKLPKEEMLECYKGQQSVERGFRFLKDPFFLTSSVFLKKDTRIVALSMIMCLCLLVYTLAQRLLRHRILQTEKKVANQKGKPTDRPTIRWIFQVFEGVHVLLIKDENTTEEQVLNLYPERRLILEILGPPFQKIYENAA